MLHTRNLEQENLTHAHQVAGAAKSNALAPKTPGPQQAGKTPARKIALNDENTVFRTGKGKAKDAFQTPAPRERAPLGAKTTNAKAKPFATPGAALTAGKPGLKTPAQQRATSARKNKLRIHNSPSQLSVDPLNDHGPDLDATTSTQGEIDDDAVPDIDHALRLPEPEMEDPVFDVHLDHTFPMLKPENLMRGAHDLFHNQPGPDGLTYSQRREKKWDEETEAYLEAEEKRVTEQAMQGDWKAEMDRLIGDDDQKPATSQSSTKGEPKSTTAHSKTKSTLPDRKPPSDAISKSAASALSTGPRSTHQRSASTATSRFAAPTAASQAKKATVAKATDHDGSSISHNRTRSAVPMASRTTIGRAKGRQVSAELRAGKPDMAARTKPNVSALKQGSKQPISHAGEKADQGEGILEHMQRQYEAEQVRKDGVTAQMDEDSIEALEAALHEDLLEYLSDPVLLDMPEEEEDPI